MVERFVGTLTQGLAKFCQEGQTDWDQKVPAFLMAYRSAEHEATGYSPAKVMMGHEIRLPIDLLMGRPPDEGLPTTVSDFVREHSNRLEEIHHQVRKNLKISGEAMKSHYDVKARTADFEEGEKVWLYNPRCRKGLSPKLQSPWEGPYIVLEKLSAVTYRIRQQGRRKVKVVHVDRLSKYRGTGHFTWGEGEHFTPTGTDGPADEPDAGGETADEEGAQETAGGGAAAI